MKVYYRINDRKKWSVYDPDMYKYSDKITKLDYRMARLCLLDDHYLGGYEREIGVSHIIELTFHEDASETTKFQYTTEYEPYFVIDEIPPVGV